MAASTPNVDGKTYKRLQVGQSFNARTFFRNLSDLPSGNVTDISVYDEKIAHVSGDSIIADRWGKTPVTANVNGKFYVFHLEVRPAGAVAMPMVVTGDPVGSNGAGGYALKSDGTVWTFHRKSTYNTYAVPKQISEFDNIIQITASLSYAYLLKSDGTVYTCNNGALSGQTPNNETGSGIVAISNKTFNGMGPGVHAICSDGRLIGLGKNSYYSSLGYNGAENSWNYVAGGESGTEYMENVVSVSSMGMSSYALKADGSAYIWGFDGGNDLGYISYKPPQRMKAGDAPSDSGYLENVVMLYGAGGYNVFLTAVLADGKGYKAGLGVGQNFVLLEASSANPGAKITEIGLCGGKAWETYRGGIALMNDNTCWNIITGDKVETVKGFTNLSSPSESGAIIAGVKEDGSVWWLGDGLSAPAAIMEKESTGIGADGHEAYLEVSQAKLTRDNQNENVTLYNDNIMRADGTFITAIQIGDTVSVDPASIVGYNSDGETGKVFYLMEPEKIEEETYIPENIKFESYNTAVADVDKYTGVITPKKTGTTYIIVRDDKGSMTSFKLNVIPKNSAYIAYPRLSRATQSSIALKADGTAWWWGNLNGHIESLPTAVLKEDGSPLIDIIDVQGIDNSYYALDKYGRVWLWGQDGGMLAQNNGTGNEYSKYPVRPLNADGSFFDESHKIVQITGFGTGCKYLTAQGEIYLNGFTYTDLSRVYIDEEFSNPVNLSALLGIGKIKQLPYEDNYGSGVTFGAVRCDGRVITWRDNYANALGQGINTGGANAIYPPGVVLNLSEVLELTVYVHGFSCITADGNSYSWGRMSDTAYTGASGDYSTPIVGSVEFGATDTSGKPISIMAARSALVLKENGTIFSSSGSNQYGYGAGLGYVRKSMMSGFVVAGESSDTETFLTNVISIDGGNQYYINNTCYDLAGAITEDGMVYTWGIQNSDYSMGDESHESTTAPVRVHSIYGGTPHLKFGSLTLNGQDMQMYDGTIIKSDGTQISAVQVGDTLVIDKNSIWAYHGYFDVFSDERFKPNGLSFSSYDPTVASVDDNGVVTPKKTGVTYIMVRDNDGRMASFRLNVLPRNENYIAYPQIAAGAGVTYALKADGTVWTWGSNYDDKYELSASGKLGTGSLYGTATIPVQVMKNAGAPLDGIIEISGTENAGYALDQTGHIWTWGSSKYGALGQGEYCDKQGSITTSVKYPVLVKNENGTGYLGDDARIVHIAASVKYDSTDKTGWGGIYALNEKGEMFAWGIVEIPEDSWVNTNAAWQNCWVVSSLPINFSSQYPNLHYIKNITRSTAAIISSVLKEDGTVYRAGGNMYGLGDTSIQKNYYVSAAHKIPVTDENGEEPYIIAINASWVGIGALTYNGEYYMWGVNATNQLGETGTSGWQSGFYTIGYPTKIEGFSKNLSGVMPVLGQSHSVSFMLMSDGKIYSMGTADDYALGQGVSGAASGVPGVVQTENGSPLTNMIQVGYSQAYANNNFGRYFVTGYGIKNDGSVWSWGYEYGDSYENMLLGDETIGDRAYADQVLSQYGENHLEVSGGTLLRGTDTYPVSIHEGTLTIGGGMRSAVHEGDVLTLDINSLIGCLPQTHCLCGIRDFLHFFEIDLNF